MKQTFRMAAIVLAVLVSSGSALAGEAAASQDFNEAFERIRQLVGRWDVVGSPAVVTFSLTADGSAIVEEFRGRRGMASVYHMDGEDLVMTHYCSAGNQPRMKATAWSPESSSIRFDFVDVTNLATPTAYHTRELEMVFEDEDHIQLRFNGLDEGEEAPVRHSLVRLHEEPQDGSGPQAFEPAFERLKALVGSWKEIEDPGRRVTYRLTGHGSALVEEFQGEPAMTSVYHMDGPELRLTHYCNAGNQPRMKATSSAPDRGILRFEFIDVTNLSSPGAYYTRDLEITFLDDERVVLNFMGQKEGREIPGPLELVRTRAANLGPKEFR